MPGNYMVTMDIPVEFVVFDYYLSEPWYWVRSTTIPWVNCTGGEGLFVEFEAIVIPVDEQSLVLEVYGCDGGLCELVVSDDLTTHAGRVREPYDGGSYREVLVGGVKYELDKSFAEYEYLNITVTPGFLVPMRFTVSSLVRCFFHYEATVPVLTVDGVHYKQYVINIPARVDATLHQLGLGVSMIGLALILSALHVQQRKTRSAEDPTLPRKHLELNEQPPGG